MGGGGGGGGVGVALAPNNSKSNMFRQKYNKFTCLVLYLRSIFMINLVSQKGNLVLKMVRSGQVRSECLTCTFRRSCCGTRLSRTQVPASGTGTKRGRGCKGGGGGTACIGGYKRVRGVRPESVAGRA